MLFTCSITRVVHLELLPNQTASEFIKAFKKLIARRESPNIVYSDNAKTYVAAAKWIQNIKRDVLFQDFLIKEEIQWKFNISRAQWWGGQFERMVGLVKQSLYKATGYANLNLNELEEILLDIEVNLNNRPLTYLEDDVAFPVLTPNSLIFGQPTTLPEEDCAEDDGYTEMKKRSRYIKKCKESIWKRWNAEYLRALRERHNMKHKVKKMKISIGVVVLIKNADRNRRKWKIGTVDKLCYGRDVIRAVQLRSGKSFIQRPIQHLYPLELNCDINREKEKELNVEAPPFRSKRTAAAVAEIGIQNTGEFENADV